MAPAAKGAPPWGGDGPIDAICSLSSSAADFRPNSQIQAPSQAEILPNPRVISFPALPRRRHVPPPQRIDVRITAVNAAGAPYGRSRTFRLTHGDIDALVAHAERMEARA